ncbi:hypothetical protein LTR95_019086, partial [Oleoguttula sp. CCFEE 5521]
LCFDNHWFGVELKTKPEVLYGVYANPCDVSNTLWECSKHPKKRVNDLNYAFRGCNASATNQEEQAANDKAEIPHLREQLAALHQQQSGPGDAAQAQKELEDQEKEIAKTDKVARDFLHCN